MEHLKIGIPVRNLDVGAAFSTISGILLKSIDHSKIKFILLTDKKINHEMLKLPSIERIEIKPYRIPWRLWINSPTINKRLKDIDLFLGIDNTVPIALKKKKIVFIYDIYGWLSLFKGYYEFIMESNLNEIFTFFILKPLSIWLSDLVVVPSEYTKKTLRSILKVPESKIRIIRIGISSGIGRQDEKTVSDILQKYNIKKPYILAIGNYRYHRNYQRLSKVFTKFSDRYSLVVRGYMGEKGRAVFKDLKNCFLIENKLNENEISALYSGAELLVHVTLMEGFGLPVLESMACGCPVIASNRCSIPEIAEDGALYVNPESEKEIENAIETLINKPEIKERLVRRGYEISKKYNEKEYIQKIMDTIYEFVNERR